MEVITKYSGTPRRSPLLTRSPIMPSRGQLQSQKTQAGRDGVTAACRWTTYPVSLPHSEKNHPPPRQHNPTTTLYFAAGAILAGFMPRPFWLRKNSTPLALPSAPSVGSTHWHQRALFQMALMKPTGPSRVSAR